MAISCNKTIDGYYREWWESMGVKGASRYQVEEMKLAFYSGIYQTFGIMAALSDSGRSEEAQHLKLGLWYSEVQEYFEDYFKKQGLRG